MRSLTVIVHLCFSVYSFAQINVNIDSDCLVRNSATISNAMVCIFGKDSVKQILKNNINIVFVCNVDSLGYIKKLERIWSKQEISDNFTVSIENYLVSNKIRFYICYAQDPPNITKTCIVASVREHFKNNKGIIISYGFPGELMKLYEYEKEKAREKGFCLSKYDYFLKQISRYF